jgi:hypothetical protein
MRLVGPPEQQHRGAVRARVVAPNLGDRALKHQHEARMHMHVTVNPLPRRVLNLREHQPADAAPAQDFAVGEVGWRLRVHLNRRFAIIL